MNENELLSQLLSPKLNRVEKILYISLIIVLLFFSYQCLSARKACELENRNEESSQTIDIYQHTWFPEGSENPPPLNSSLLETNSS